MTRQPAPVRVPTPEGPRSRGSEIVRGLAAIVAIAAIVVGVPLGLWSAFGQPWPSSTPSRDWIYVNFDARLILDILVAVVWLAWLHFVICLLVEIATEVQGRGLPTRVPGGGVGTQPLARRLVATAALVLTGMAVTVPSATAAAQGTGPDKDRSATSVSSVVQGFEDRSDQAGHQSQVDHLSSVNDATPATVVNTKQGAKKLYMVQAPEGRNYDCLWDIAERYLGDGRRYKELVALNRGRTQADGSSLTDPDLILPGWVLLLPADAQGPGLQDQLVTGPNATNPSTVDSGDLDHGTSEVPDDGGADGGTAQGGATAPTPTMAGARRPAWSRPVASAPVARCWRRGCSSRCAAAAASTAGPAREAAVCRCRASWGCGVPRMDPRPQSWAPPYGACRRRGNVTAGCRPPRPWCWAPTVSSRPS